MGGAWGAADCRAVAAPRCASAAAAAHGHRSRHELAAGGQGQDEAQDVRQVVVQREVVAVAAHAGEMRMLAEVVVERRADDVAAVQQHVGRGQMAVVDGLELRVRAGEVRVGDDC